MAWYDDVLTPDLTYDDGGIAKPIRDHQFVRESPDLPSFVKKAFDTHREVGSRVPLRIEKDRNPDGTFAPRQSSVQAWREQHLPKLYENGILAKPPDSPAAYGLDKQPEKLPPGMVWDQERANKLANILHKHAVPPALVPELLEVQSELMVAEIKKYESSYEDAILALKREFGEEYDTRMEQAKKLSEIVFKDEGDLDFLAESGFGNHPRFLGMMMRLAPLAEQDSSLVEQVSQVRGPSPDNLSAVYAEYNKIATDKSHPWHEGFIKGDPEVSKKIDEMFRKVVGPGSFQIGSQLTEGMRP